MSVLVVVLSNRKQDYLKETINSIITNLKGDFTLSIVDDSGDLEHYSFLENKIPYTWYAVSYSEANSGYDSAMKRVHEVFLQSNTDFLVTWEEDFILEEEVHVDTLITALQAPHKLCQVILRRQAWYANEIALGGVIEACEAQGDKFIEDKEHNITIHQSHFSNNPNIMSREIILKNKWFSGTGTEVRYALHLFAQGYSSSYLGSKADCPKVKHIGVRSGTNY